MDELQDFPLPNCFEIRPEVLGWLEMTPSQRKESPLRPCLALHFSPSFIIDEDGDWCIVTSVGVHLRKPHVHWLLIEQSPVLEDTFMPPGIVYDAQFNSDEYADMYVVWDENLKPWPLLRNTGDGAVRYLAGLDGKATLQIIKFEEDSAAVSEYKDLEDEAEAKKIVFTEDPLNLASQIGDGEDEWVFDVLSQEEVAIYMDAIMLLA